MTRYNITFRRYLLPPLDREGKWFVSGFAILAALLWWAHPALGVIGLVLTVWCFFFFRDPVRYVPSGPDTETLLIAPASGVVQMVCAAVPPPELNLGSDPVQRVSIFMSVFDCHVNRLPCAGTISTVAYHKGQFLSAGHDKASDVNERNSIALTRDDSRRVALVQIAGLVARRIRCDVTEGSSGVTGERLGLIRFGSRVDVYLPDGGRFLVAPGQATISGETVIGDLGPADDTPDSIATEAAHRGAAADGI